MQHNKPSSALYLTVQPSSLVLQARFKFRVVCNKGPNFKTSNLILQEQRSCCSLLKALNPTECPENDHNHCGFANFKCDPKLLDEKFLPQKF
jgi:hypothetical protein